VRYFRMLKPFSKHHEKTRKPSGLTPVELHASSLCGSGNVVCFRHELALQPGMAVFQEYPDLKDRKVKLDGDNVVEFHKLPEFQQVTLKVLRWEERDKRLVIKEAQMVA
jgi:hypothetical protein